jgi:fructose-bisphosphate aldolase class I
LARYAALVQEAGMVPMVEPEVLIDGDHTIEKCNEVTSEVLQTLFQELKEQGVLLEGTILKTSMVLSGNKCIEQADINTVAKLTVETLINKVPKELAGVVFLSGGQDDQKATEHLNAMNIIGGMPWPLSFSYGRGIQQAALNIWGENQENIKQAQEALVKRAKLNGLAALGKYNPEMEN